MASSKESPPTRTDASFDDASQTHEGHLGGAAADIADHTALGVANGQSRTNARSHGLFDEVNFPAPALSAELMTARFFHLGSTTGNGDDHAGFTATFRLPWTLRMK